MKSFFGWLLLGSGVLLAGWGAYYCMTGAMRTMLAPLPLNAMAGGLVGLLMVVLGFAWSRD